MDLGNDKYQIFMESFFYGRSEMLLVRFVYYLFNADFFKITLIIFMKASYVICQCCHNLSENMTYLIVFQTLKYLVLLIYYLCVDSSSYSFHIFITIFSLLSLVYRT